MFENEFIFASGMYGVHFVRFFILDYKLEKVPTKLQYIYFIEARASNQY